MATKKNTRLNRKWRDIVFVQNGTDTVDLPIGLDLEGLHLYFFGSINVTTAYTGIKSEGLSALIRRIDILADGQTIASIPGTVLVQGNFMRGYTAIKVNPGIAIGNYLTPEVVGFIDFAHVDGVRPKDSNLRTAGMRSLQMRVVWGALTDMYIGAGVAVPSLTMSVAVRETASGVDELGGNIAPPFRRLHRFSERTYPVSTQDRIPLDSGMLYRAIVLRSELNGDLSQAVITNVKVMVGSEVIMDIPAPMLFDANCNDNGVALAAGYYVVDFAPSLNQQSKLSECLDLTGRNDAFLVLDVVGGATAKVQIESHQFEVLHRAVAQNNEHHEQRRAHGLN